MTSGSILRIISIKSVLIGALTYLAATWVLGFAMIAMAVNAVDHGMDDIGGGAVGAGLSLVAIGLPPLIAGYVAAAIARRHELINGTLVGVLCALVPLLIEVTALSEWKPADLTYLVTLAPVPILSFIGACLYLVFGWPKRPARG
jgi:hypothetical protein